jgi:hypothetical protein
MVIVWCTQTATQTTSELFTTATSIRADVQGVKHAVADHGSSTFLDVSVQEFVDLGLHYVRTQCQQQEKDAVQQDFLEKVVQLLGATLQGGRSSSKQQQQQKHTERILRFVRIMEASFQRIVLTK